MRLSSASILSGFNTHYGSSVVVHEVDLGVFADLRSGQAGPHFADRFVVVSTGSACKTLTLDYCARVLRATRRDALSRAIAGALDHLPVGLGRRLFQITLGEMLVLLRKQPV